MIGCWSERETGYAACMNEGPLQGFRSAGIRVGVAGLKIERWMRLAGFGGFVGPMDSVSSVNMEISREKGQ